MTKRSIVLATVMLLAAGAAHAQERFNNHQWSLNAGTMSVPEATFLNLDRQPIEGADPSALMPWTAGVRCERERMATDRLGWGWSLGLGLRHTGWTATVPALTPGVGNTGLVPDEDWTLRIPLMGLWGEGGAYGSLHLSGTFEVYAGLGLAAVHYWNIGGEAQCASYTDDAASGSVLEGLSSTLLGAYGLLGLKMTFADDFFVSLSARYAYGLNDGGTDGLFDFEGAFYSTRVAAPFTSDLAIMLGVGIMFED